MMSDMMQSLHERA